jgi:hypothetical protein
MPDGVTDKPVLMAIYPLVDSVTGEDEHGQEQAVADYV